jgi:hypothetical protein
MRPLSLVGLGKVMLALLLYCVSCFLNGLVRMKAMMWPAQLFCGTAGEFGDGFLQFDQLGHRVVKGSCAGDLLFGRGAFSNSMQGVPLSSRTVLFSTTDQPALEHDHRAALYPGLEDTFAAAVKVVAVDERKHVGGVTV